MKILRFEITDKCNQKCDMCWSTDWEHKDLEWPFVEKMIIDYSNMYPKGIVVLTSREPLLSSNFEKVLFHHCFLNHGIRKNERAFSWIVDPDNRLKSNSRNVLRLEIHHSSFPFHGIFV